MDRDQRFSYLVDRFGGWQLPLLFAFVLALPVGHIAFSQLVPAVSARAFVREIDAYVRLELYYFLGDEQSGRLVVDSPKGGSAAISRAGIGRTRLGSVFI